MHRVASRRSPALVILALVLLSGCGAPPAVLATPSPVPPAAPSATTVANDPAPAAPATAQPVASPVSYGPGPASFPPGVNPLSGQLVSDPSLLKIPALLISISHFPATARPQAGLSFAPFVFEFSITEGQTRFLAAFHGEWPAPEVPVQGDCPVRQGLFASSATLLGNRVWLDADRDGIQQPYEPGIPGICVRLLDATGAQVGATTTDSNGYYGFNAQPDASYTIEFVKPSYLSFTASNVGDDSHDSDADPETGRTVPIRLSQDDLSEDAGMWPNAGYVPPAAPLPAAQVGPVRSGRLLYAYIGNFFQDSCLIYAFASSEILPLIPHCAFVSHETIGGGAMLDIERMKAIAEDNARKTAGRPFNYTSNVFSDTIPPGGGPAQQIRVYFASLNQSGWFYDPLYGAYLRYVDTADKNSPGVLHPEVDRLTGRQLHYENVIVMMADTDVVSPTNLDIHLDQGNTGYAYLFRDGQVFPIRWSTRAGEYEQKTGFRRPIQFVQVNGTPAALKPGHTWITIVTPFSTISAQQPGVYFVGYAAPEGEAR